MAHTHQCPPILRVNQADLVASVVIFESSDGGEQAAFGFQFVAIGVFKRGCIAIGIGIENGIADLVVLCAQDQHTLAAGLGQQITFVINIIGDKTALVGGCHRVVI